MRKWFAVAAFAALAACGSSNDDTIVTPVSATIKGNYVLSTVNGKTLPFTVSQDASTTRFLTGSALNFGSNGSWTESQQYSIKGSTGASTSSTFTRGGTFAANGTNATLTVTFGGSGALAITSDAAGGTLTLTDAGTTYVYTR